MTWAISGRLESSRGERVALAQCRVEVFFELKVSDHHVDSRPSNSRKTSATRSNGATAATSTIHSRVSAHTTESGEFKVILPDRGKFASNRLNFVVSAPSGQTIGELSLSGDRLQDFVRIPVRRVASIKFSAPKDVPKPSARRITGIVIERNGKPLLPNSQIVLFARERGEKIAKTPAKDSPVFSARPDRSGYFLARRPAACLRALRLWSRESRTRSQ